MSLLASAAIFLAAAVLIVPIACRLKLGAALGYLAAGVIIGPWVLGLVTNVDNIMHFAELGVVLLLFVIGLGLQPSRLWVLRKAVFGLGGAQVGLSAAALAVIGLALGQSWQSALVMGLGLAMSSTALVLQVLAERRQLTTHHGRAAFGILLFQDLSVIPLLALIPLLSATPAVEHSATPWLAAAGAVAVIAGVIVGGHWLLRPVLRLVARTHVPEIFTAAALLVVIGVSLLMVGVGLSVSLGAFLAGVLLANSEYRHELEANLEPFKGLLLGLFFISVGTSVDLGLFGHQPLAILLGAAGLMGVKAALLYVVGRAAGQTKEASRGLAASLCQGGEFAFVLFALAASSLVMDLGLVDLLVVIVALSMAATPLALSLAGFAATDENMPGRKTRMFISYSRDDSKTAEKFHSFLQAEGFDGIIDVRDLPFGEQWQTELEDAIRRCDTVVWLVSSASIRSRWCRWEAAKAVENGKRLFPVMIESVSPALFPDDLRKVQVFPHTGVLDLGNADQRDLLIGALTLDNAWLKEQTRISERAHVWVRKERDPAWLIGGEELMAAQRWLSEKPQTAPAPAAYVLDFLQTSSARGSREGLNK